MGDSEHALHPVPISLAHVLSDYRLECSGFRSLVVLCQERWQIMQAKRGEGRLSNGKEDFCKLTVRYLMLVK